MKTAVTALTRKGSALAVKLGKVLGADVYLKQEFLENKEGETSVYPITGDFTRFTGMLFGRYDALVFIMASGIVVRAIAPYIKDKRTDPAVVVMDEKGQFCVSLLSGHIGGANELAREIAAGVGGTAVITTSTDVNGVIAFDVFAGKNGCVIENIRDLKYISSELVNGGWTELYSDYAFKGSLPDPIVLYKKEAVHKCVVVLSNRTDTGVQGEKVLYIRPKNLILGIGCRRGTPFHQIKDAVHGFMEKNKKSPLSLKCAATIDLKKDEQGLLEFCREQGLELKIVPREAVKEVEANYSQSGFVKEKTGVSSVAEPCAVLAGTKARLVCGKTRYKGITLALAEEVKEFEL